MLWNKKGLPKYINASEDLVTSSSETKAGFIALALEKSRQAVPYVEEGKYLKTVASEAEKPKDLLRIDNIQRAMLTASGVSDKASSYFDADDKKEAVRVFIDKFLEPAGKNFVDELVYRFLLIRGDSLGGSMRNLIGRFGEIKLTRALLSVLGLQGRDVWYLDKETKKWIKVDSDTVDIENEAKGLSWITDGEHRTLLYNKKLTLVDNKNIDLVLLNCRYKDAIEKLQSQNAFLALGELKGGIDPAGADEHWKTANSALSRIRDSFEKFDLAPDLIFIGAAIETSMAEEIYKQLKNKSLAYVANLTKDKQVFASCEWLISL